ncbi:peroxiredoxin [Candidatus Methylospira mobilis]|uniref:thioredoxin-dependent peroxiredoxin n=1 Tax=Candidatus Methylospira mobilis TaxID=1808979 RepID=A0A5Q0BLQ8_9GAMM|nr:peroxiredoxin [Candidatus Methylospira mobilis]QFY44539.1 peroxiredoxin [Candidatus Methylospira mobilis]WNV06030.1 peroxiredoxin [Candidatus Methylospira mobilis]
MKNSLSRFKPLALLLSWLPFANPAQAEALQVGQPAPRFELTAQDGAKIDLASRQGKGWTVLYFYPKAGTPGCTTQACAFRDAIEAIRRQNAEVYGISTDEVKDLLSFHQKHKLAFTLLSDPDAKVTEAYGVKMPVLKMAKRWTFIVDPSLIVRQIDNDVDPALDARKVAESLKKLQAMP